MTRSARLFGALLIASAMALVAAPASAGTCTSSYNNAHGDNRHVNIWVAGFWLHHTYECMRYSGSSGTTSGHHSYGGTADGCASCSRFATRTVWSNAPHCASVQGHLTYAITGVCHQGTNRALQATPIPFVVSWGGVGGSGVSKSLFCTYGAGLWCYGAPC
jgi:hypothetical protein